jgi:hypothetical protein
MGKPKTPAKEAVKKAAGKALEVLWDGKRR